MIIQEAIELFKEHQKGTVKKNTLKSYGKFLEQFREKFSASEVISVSADQIGRFLEETTEGLSRSPRHLRYAQIKAFFNYVIEVTGINANNPCTAVVLAKAYKILDKETVDEMIFNASSLRDRLILELQGKMRPQNRRSSQSQGLRSFRQKDCDPRAQIRQRRRGCLHARAYCYKTSGLCGRQTTVSL